MKAFLLPLPLLAAALLAAAEEGGSAPPRGHLVIHGGGQITRDVMELFRDLGGGAEGHLVYVPTSQEGDLDTSPEAAPRWLRSLGFGALTVLHTRDREVADTPEFAAPLETATAVWFSGGRQWRSTDAYLGTRTHAAFHAIHRRGGVIGGSSAGATLQGSFLVRGAPEGNHVMVAPGRETGFGFLPQAAIDQHAIARDRLGDMIPVIEQRPHLLGISLDEGAALHVHGGIATVMGISRVAIHDARRWPEGGPEGERYRLIGPGDRFDLERRLLLE